MNPLSAGFILTDFLGLVEQVPWMPFLPSPAGVLETLLSFLEFFWQTDEACDRHLKVYF